MIKRAGERKVNEMKNVQGGKESVFANIILEGEEFVGTGRLFNVMTFPPKSSIGYHVHTGECEAYLVLSGHGVYCDNGEVTEIGPGDVTYCAVGEGHGMENMGDEDLVIVALILFDKRG